MSLQPASGARDLNPQQVEINHLIVSNLSEVYKSWGYEEVTPPFIERLPTLMAGDAISNKDIIKLVADEPLGLRPEMTASISRAASTRLIKKPRPLRLWSNGTVFKSKDVVEGGTFIEENLQSGVELFGVKSINAEIELLSLLFDCLKSLNLKESLEPTILIGHTELMDMFLLNFPIKNRLKIRSVLTNLDQIGIEKNNFNEEIKSKLKDIIQFRGKPNDLINKLKLIYGENKILDKLTKLFTTIDPISNKSNVKIQLDPTFQPHFKLYNGLVFELVCKGKTNNIVIARGGRYDQIVEKFSSNNQIAAGVGFSFAIDKARELITESEIKTLKKERILIAYSYKSSINEALLIQGELHEKGNIAILELEPLNNKSEATERLSIRNCNKLEWLS